MKNIHYCLLLAVATILMASCGYPDHLETLPKETVAVVSFDLAGMVSKGDLHKLQEADFYKKMQEQMAAESAEAAKETDEFLKNPLNYGVNFLEPVYLFAINNNQARPFAGFCIALGDAPKFETFITKVTQQGDTTYPIEMATGYSHLTTDKMIFAWNELALIVTVKPDSLNLDDAVLQSIFTKKDKDQSVVSKPGFKKFYKNSKDISGWMSSDLLAGFANAMDQLTSTPTYAEEMGKVQEQLKGSSFQFHISFLEDEIRTEYMADMPDELKKQYDKDVFRKGNPDKMSNLVRAEDLAVISASINLQNYLSLMSNNPALTGEAKETMASYIAVVQQFVAPFDGDFLFTVSDITVTEKEVTEKVPVESTDTTELTADAGDDLDAYSFDDEDSYDWDMEYRDTTYMKTKTFPVFLAATTVNDESLGLMLGMLLGKNKPKAGKVTTSDLGDFILYSTIKDKVLLVSNDKKTIEDVNAGTFENGGKSTQAKGSSNHGIYVYANLDLNEYPKPVQEELAKNATKTADENAAMLKFFSMFEHVEAYNNNDFSAVVSFKLKQTNNNSLYTIVESIGNAAYSIGALN